MGDVGYINCEDIVLVSYLVSAEELLQMMKKTTQEQLQLDMGDLPAPSTPTRRECGQIEAW